MNLCKNCGERLSGGEGPLKPTPHHSRAISFCSGSMKTFPTLFSWLEYLQANNPVEIEMGLARIGKVSQALGLRFNCPIVTVGGTNGKGSVCAMLEAILLEAGYKVGCYTSPHFLSFNERARI